MCVCCCFFQIEFVTGTKKGTNPSSTAASTTSNTTTTSTGKALQHLLASAAPVVVWSDWTSGVHEQMRLLG